MLLRYTEMVVFLNDVRERVAAVSSLAEYKAERLLLPVIPRRQPMSTALVHLPSLQPTPQLDA